MFQDTCNVFFNRHWHNTASLWIQHNYCRTISILAFVAKNSKTTPLSKYMYLTAMFPTRTTNSLLHPFTHSMAIFRTIYISWSHDQQSAQCWYSLSFTDSLPTVFCLVTAHVKLSLTPVVVHVPYLTKYFSLLPALVVYSTDRPHATWNIRNMSVQSYLFIFLCCFFPPIRTQFWS
jgi:hypothetical protein